MRLESRSAGAGRPGVLSQKLGDGSQGPPAFREAADARPLSRCAPWQARAKGLLGLLVALLLAVPAWAQDIPPEKGSKSGGGRKTSRDTIRMDDPPPPSDQRKGPDAKTAPAGKKTEPELLVEALARWPATEAKRAALRLAYQPSVSFPLLEARMLEPDLDWRSISGIAASLGHIGDPRALELIEAKLQDRKMFLHSGALIRAIVRIDPVGGKRRLLATLMHPASAVVREAAKLLEERVDAVDIPTLQDIYEAGGPTARAAAVTLMARTDPALVRADLIRGLRDKSAEVAYAAAAALSTDLDPENLELLRRAALSPLDRQLAYAYLALSLRADRTTEQLLRPGDVKMLVGGRGLKSLDPLNRTVAALVLADAGYFHEFAEIDAVYDQELVPVLISAWLGQEFWSDLATLQPLALGRLQRLTGQYSIESRREWSSWWKQNGADFVARRVLIHVDPAHVSTLMVTVAGRDAPGGETTMMATDADLLPPPIGGEMVLLLPEAAGLELARAINDSGVLAVRRGITGEATGVGPLEVAVRAGKRQRRVSLRPQFLAEGESAFLAAVERLREQFRWQRYRPIGSAVDLETFVTAMHPLFAPEVSQRERDEALARLMARAVDGVTIERNLAALADLEGRPELPPLLGDDEIDRLLGVLGKQENVTALGEAITRVLALTGKPEVTPLLTEFLTTHASVRTHQLLVTVLSSAGDAELVAALDSESTRVQVAALASLTPESDGGRGAELARKALHNTTPLVHSEAIRALGRLRVEGARQELDELASRPGEFRIPAIEALGMLGGRDSLAVIMAAYAGGDPVVRLAAVEAFAASREPEGISAVVFAMSGDPSPLVREVAARAVREIGTEAAAQALRKLAIDPGQPEVPRATAVRSLALLRGAKGGQDLQRLLFDPSERVADEAALALAGWRDPTSVPRLIEMLEAGRSTTRSRQALESVSLESFDQGDRSVLSALYSGWWEVAKDQGPRGWFVEALVRRGYTDRALGKWVTGQEERGIVPVMLRALGSEEWFIRRAADLTLRDILGRRVGEQEPWTPPGEVAHMTKAWNDVWAEVLGR